MLLLMLISKTGRRTIFKVHNIKTLGSRQTHFCGIRDIKDTLYILHEVKKCLISIQESWRIVMQIPKLNN